MKMKKFLAMLLAAAMLFAFAACGDDKDDSKKSSVKTSENTSEQTSKKEEKAVELTAEALEGEWETKFSLKEVLEFSGDEMSEETFEVVKKIKRKVGVIFTFDEGSLMLSVDEDDMNDAMEDWFEEFIDYYWDGGFAENEGMTQEEFLEKMAEKGIDRKTFGETIREEIYTDDMPIELDVFTDEYSVEGDKICLSNGEYIKVKFAKNSFKIVKFGKERNPFLEGKTFTKK